MKMGGWGSRHKKEQDKTVLTDVVVPENGESEYLRLEDARNYYEIFHRDQEELLSKVGKLESEISSQKVIIQVVTQEKASLKQEIQSLKGQVKSMASNQSHGNYYDSSTKNASHQLGIDVESEIRSTNKRISDLESAMQSGHDTLRRTLHLSDSQKADEITRLQKRVTELEKENAILKHGGDRPPLPASSAPELASLRSDFARARNDIDQIDQWIKYQLTSYIINLIWMTYFTPTAPIPLMLQQPVYEHQYQNPSMLSHPASQSEVRPAQPAPAQAPALGVIPQEHQMQQPISHVPSPAHSSELLEPEQLQQPLPLPPWTKSPRLPDAPATRETLHLSLEKLNTDRSSESAPAPAASNLSRRESVTPVAISKPLNLGPSSAPKESNRTSSSKVMSSSRAQFYVLIDPANDSATKSSKLFIDYLMINRPQSSKVQIIPIGEKKLDDTTVPRREALCVMPLISSSSRWLTDLNSKRSRIEKVYRKFSQVQIVLLKPGKKTLVFPDEDNEAARDADGNETGHSWKVLGRFLYSPTSSQFHPDGSNVNNLELFWGNVDAICSAITDKK